MTFWYATDEVLRIKSLVDRHPEGITAKGIAAEADCPLTSARRYGKLLVEMNLIVSTTPWSGVPTEYYPR